MLFGQRDQGLGRTILHIKEAGVNKLTIRSLPIIFRYDVFGYKVSFNKEKNPCILALIFKCFVVYLHRALF